MSVDQTPWRPGLNPDLKMQIVDDEAILLDRANERVHQLNGVATFILQCCDGERTESEIVQEVLSRYDVDTEVAQSDATALLAQLRVLAILV